MRTGKMIPLLAIGALFGFAIWAVSVHAQESFYKGKTIRLIVGLAPGGGYDLYSRVIARHMGKHIPGHPIIVVENMTGAGSGLRRTICTTQPSPTGSRSAIF
jgi:tripartite-type tricarboxylate transporter receptor subunit TctC